MILNETFNLFVTQIKQKSLCYFFSINVSLNIALLFSKALKYERYQL